MESSGLPERRLSRASPRKAALACALQIPSKSSHSSLKVFHFVCMCSIAYASAGLFAFRSHVEGCQCINATGSHRVSAPGHFSRLHEWAHL